MIFPSGPACTEQDIWRVAWRDYALCIPAHQVLAAGADGIIRRSDPWTMVTATANLAGLAGRFAQLSGMPDRQARSGAYNQSRVVDVDIFAVAASDAGGMTLRRVEQPSGVGMPPGSADAEYTGVRFLVGYVDPQIDEATRDVDLLVYADTAADLRYAEWRRKCVIWSVLAMLYQAAWQQARDDLYAAKMNAAVRMRDRLLAEFRERTVARSFAAARPMHHTPMTLFPFASPFGPVPARAVADLPGGFESGWGWPVGYPYSLGGF